MTLKDQISQALSKIAEDRGMKLRVVRRATESLLEGAVWRKAERLERQAEIKAEIASWPEWQREAAQAALSQSYEPPADRGEDCNPRW